MFGRLLHPEIQDLIEAREFGALKEIFKEWPAPDLAELFEELPEKEEALIFRLLPHAVATETFEHLEHSAQERLLASLARDEAAALLNQMSPDDRTALLEQVPGEVVASLVQLLSPEQRAIAQSLLNFPEQSVGRLMTPLYLAVRDDWTVQEVLDHIRSKGSKGEEFDHVYVVDDKRHVLDDLHIREFLLHPLSMKVREFRDDSFVSLNVLDDQERAVEAFRKYDRASLPVVDANNVLLGVVTSDDILDVAEKEATEDIQKFGGSEALELPYLESRFSEMVRKRASWLTVLFLGEMLTATAMGFFEDEISKAVVLALFVPLIISSGGNSGSQAATLVIRALALGEITLSDWSRVLRRELLSGATLGAVLGVIGFLRVTLWSAFSNIYGPHWLLVALTVATSLVGVVLWGSLSGAMLPFLLKKCGFDPAASSAPFVATLVDVTGLVIYFLVAIFWLRGVLL